MELVEPSTISWFTVGLFTNREFLILWEKNCPVIAYHPVKTQEIVDFRNQSYEYK